LRVGQAVVACQFACESLDQRDRSLKNSPRQPFKVLASLRSFVVFVFHRIIMPLFLLLLIFAASQGPSPAPTKAGGVRQQDSRASSQATNSDQRGTEQSPLVIKLLPTERTKQESEEDAQDRHEKASSDWWIVCLTGVLALVAFLQLLVFGYQAKKLRETVESAKDQSSAMERHISEAARSAAAMEGVAKSLEITAEASRQAAIASQQSITNLRQQMRAWLTVIIGNGIPQQRDKNLRFEASPLIFNSGLTPARNVRHRIKSGIFSIPLPDNFDQSVTAEKEAGGNLIGAHQSAQMPSVIDDYVPDGEVEDIKAARGRGVYAWGIVTYEDVFGETHTTTFCQQFTYLPDGKLWVSYIAGRNDAD
jgi:Sec-independent protein translocase protein TatA